MTFVTSSAVSYPAIIKSTDYSANCSWYFSTDDVRALSVSCSAGGRDWCGGLCGVRVRYTTHCIIGYYMYFILENSISLMTHIRHGT